MATDAQMQGWFQNIDRDRSGLLDHKELQEALKQAGLVVTLMTTNLFVRLFDSTRSGKVNFTDFKNIFAWMAQKDQVFYAMDTARRGSLTFQQVYQAMGQAFPGLALDTHAFQAATSVYDPDKSGTMNRTEFIAFCVFIDQCARTYASFDPQRTGSVNMPMNQFIYAVSQTK
eukprot:TRINITY_DN348_c5_g1_i1.p1 TRINITY_DN348_c5_g1~~TRINITY_DN348_c5_g1_i1.p1  ORF type:complete len:172 (+),score=21.76 TRINITY_DN348_c5_g1_i1:77-592(+)